MRTVMISTRLAALTGAAAVVFAVASGPAAASPGVSGPQLPAGGPGHWSRVTPNGTDTIADIGLARGTRGVLNVVWTSGGLSAGHAKIMDTPISSGGTVGRAAAVISGQYLLTDPDAAATSRRIYAIWNGITRSAPPSLEGTFIASRPSSGGSWSAPSYVKPLTAIPDTSSSDSATIGADGKPWVAFSGTSSLAVDHFGQAAEHQLAPKNQCCYYDAGLAVDGHSGATWIAYQSLINKHQGIYVQALANSGAPSGARRLLPGSATKGQTLVINQRVGITGRGHGRSGVYVAYETGYPITRGLDLLKLGTARPLKLASFSAARLLAGATVTDSPSGRLWAAWFDGDGTPPALFARVSDTSGGKFSAVIPVKLPAGTSAIWKVYISAQSTRLDVVALLTRNGKTAYWASQVRQPK
jgi:hypothetical protein